MLTTSELVEAAEEADPAVADGGWSDVRRSEDALNNAVRRGDSDKWAPVRPVPAAETDTRAPSAADEGDAASAGGGGWSDARSADTRAAAAASDKTRAHGRAVQVEPMKSMLLTAPGTQRLKL